DLNRARARCDDRIARGEGPHLLFVVGLHDAKTPGAAGVEHGAEDHHLARLNPGPPVLRVARHDLALLVAHVQRERRAGRLEPEYEVAHESRMPQVPDGTLSRRPAWPATIHWAAAPAVQVLKLSWQPLQALWKPRQGMA